ncbi:bifunctional riboflavin kinase/FAD synthetase [Methylobacterium frigidaeris]|uniref:Riboflavin biosynthesis protein n=1 Tax=Methylobacterium frigidaeris TaxID=2038277 RepID=A0AA37HDW2_9HYPH|nr:bifunctional riboflavin kinase/FAD synthetase [Methylobacterium frigidaeris]PIK72807.1 bifunctional riboflavin kinase/FMN adenylyltransferase [Methylobacterium frigidaeris]GJD63928.1 Bifunctional riboflavin kinase/FMN adenylyltransferase [Methylobacterium frigidaeris]
MPRDETAPRPVASPFPVHRDGEPVPEGLKGAVAALGNFDGIHQGHRALIAAVREMAGALGRPSAVLTFEPHPRAFFSPDTAMFRLTGEGEKLAVLRRLGIDGAFVRRFDAALAGTGAAAFVADTLKGELGLSGVVIGHDFHFGRGREGTPAMLEALCAENGLACRIVPAVAAGGGEAPVSSSAIRAALEAGDVATANHLLGYRWFVEGEVRHGDKRGRALGFPTANVALDACALALGIYAVRARLGDGSVRDGVASYGRRPTFDDGAPLLETYLFDFASDLYGQRIAVEFVGFIRGEARFDSAEALVARMHEDAAEARRLLAGDHTPSMLG